MADHLGRLTAWLAREGGPATLVVVGLAVLAYGFGTGEMIAVGLAVLLFVFAAVLPRLHGSFKFGARAGSRGTSTPRFCARCGQKAHGRTCNPVT